jgi:protein phosphatase 1 regulatory subunit 7
MTSPLDKENKENDGHARVDIQDDLPEGPASPGCRNSKGWDGKLRVPKSALVANPQALSDPEYSDDENVLTGEKIEADEGISFSVETIIGRS